MGKPKTKLAANTIAARVSGEEKEIKQKVESRKQK